MPSVDSGTRALLPDGDLGALTAAEGLFWSGQQIDPQSALYNMALTVEIEGEIDTEVLGRALQSVLDADAVLRTVYADHGAGPVRETLGHVSAELEVLDIAQSELDDEHLQGLLEERTRRRLALDRPLFDTCVVRRGAGRSVLYFNHHHIATDAWSMGVFFRRWGSAYQRLLTKEVEATSSHPPYSAYVERERALRDTPRLERALKHWGERPPAQTAHPVFYGRVCAGSGEAIRTEIPFGSERAAQLHEVASRAPFRGLTPEQSRYSVFATLLLAWVHRASDHSRISIGSPWHNRFSADLKATLGLFVELFPLRVEIEEGETFESLGGKVAAANMRNLRNVVPGACAAGGTRGFAAILNYITATVDDFAGMPAKARWLPSGAIDPDHALRLHVHDFDDTGEPKLEFDLNLAVFDQPAREWVVAHFLKLFDALVADMGQEVSSVSLLEWEEEKAFSVAGVEREFAPLFGASFRAAVSEYGEEPALISGADRLTYAELNERVRLFSVGLKAAGVKRGEVVGICAERSIELVVAILGVLDRGAAFLPMDPSFPEERLQYCAEAGEASLVVLGASVEAGAWGWHCSSTSIEALIQRGATAPGSPTTRAPEPTDLAYVLFTSGSTGRPKGVEVNHRALAEYVRWASDTFVDCERPRFPLFTSPAFDMTLTSIFVPLVLGGSVVVYPDEPGFSGLTVRRVLMDDEVDVVKLSPSHLDLIRDLDLSRSRVRCLIVGGEDLKTTVAQRALDAFGGDVTIFNEYGPTEATVGCMVYRYDPEVDTGASVPVGVPADNVGIHVLDRAGMPVPRGARGEICITGPGVACGYRGRDEETARSFVAAPRAGSARMYRTGDVGRWSANGWLEYLGRSDDQVKVRGVRIELGEVEAALSSHPAVHGQVVRVVGGATPSEAHCTRCGLQSAHPEARLDREGVCAPCRRFERDGEHVARYFGDVDDLQSHLDWAREHTTGEQDTIMLYSGGKDSTFALCQIVEMGARPLVFLLDNGFISEQAKTNARRVVEMLGLELHIGKSPAMPEIFAESLARFSNVCNGCFKAIYTLAMNLAVERGIPAIVTGLSRGQIFETRLSDLYRRGVFDPSEVDATILDARKAYHRMDDAVSRCMDVEIFDDDRAIDGIRFVDFYRYSSVELSELLSYLEDRTPWIRPGDTGRSTNCLINEAGIFVHRTERGFHNYTLPYSWDVRLGHKERDAALAELDDDIDPEGVRRMLDEVGYRERAAPPAAARLVAYYTADYELGVSEWKQFLSRWLPDDMMPSVFVRLEAFPLTSHGKIDRAALEPPALDRPRVEVAFVAPRTPVEEQLVDVWREVLGLRSIGVSDDFFELGGDSMHCVQIVSRARDYGIAFAPRDLFAHPTIESLAVVAAATDMPDAPKLATASGDELASLLDDFGG